MSCRSIGGFEMGLLAKLFGKDGYPAPNPNDRVDGVEPPYAEPQHQEKQRWQVEWEESQRLAEEGREIRRNIMRENGVDIEQFTDDKTIEDSLWFLDSLVPSWRKLKVSRGDVRVSGEFNNLTKAGKIPKNVFSGSMSISLEDERTLDYEIVSTKISYKADGSINMVDISINHRHKHLAVAIRNKDDEMGISTIDMYDIRRDVRSRLYNGEDIDARRMLIDEWDSVWA